jgi:hypothetical protein
MGKILWQLKANDTYQKAIGQGIETWVDFLKQPEIGLEVREANRAMELYGTFVLKYGFSIEELSEAKTKSLHYLLPVAKSGSVNEQRIRELVESAKHLSQNQFRDSLYDAKTDDQGERTYQFVVMRRCVETGTLQRVQMEGVDIEAVFLRAGIDLKQVFIPTIL